MAVNIHTDPKFEKKLTWLSKRLQKNKTQVIKELVDEKYHQQRLSFQSSKGALLDPGELIDFQQISRQLKEIKEDHDLD